MVPGDRTCLLLLEDLSKFAQRISVPGNSKVFVLTDDGRLLVPSPEPGQELRTLLLKRPEERSMPLVAESVRLWHEQKTVEPFRFKQDGEIWWSGFRRYDLGLDQRFWIGVLIPERNLVGENRRDRIALLLVSLLALGVGTLMAFYLSRLYSEPLQKLVEHSSRLQTLHTDVEVDVKSKISEVRHLAEAQENMRRALDSFARYVPVDVVRESLSRGEAAEIGGQNAEVTILFTDIAGFTTIAESMSPADLTGHMSSYFDSVVDILHRHGATVDKFIGDSIMAFWGAPKALRNHSRSAVEAVIEIREWLERANDRWRTEGLPALPTRFGRRFWRGDRGQCRGRSPFELHGSGGPGQPCATTRGSQCGSTLQSWRTEMFAMPPGWVRLARCARRADQGKDPLGPRFRVAGSQE